MFSRAVQPQILLADDDDEIVAVVSEILGDEGLRVAIATTYDDAQTLLVTRSFSLIVTDLFWQPGQPDLLQHPRELRGLAHAAPVGICTAWTLAPTTATRDGFAFCLPKPFDVATLIATVVRAIRPPRGVPGTRGVLETNAVHDKPPGAVRDPKPSPGRKDAWPTELALVGSETCDIHFTA